MNSCEIVLIEDNLDEQRLTECGIRRAELPCNVTVLRDGESAVSNLLAPSRRPPALIVLDYHLPNLSGMQVLMAVRAAPRTRFVPVIVLSIALTDDEIRGCYEQRANCCMIKAVDPGEYVDDVAAMTRYWLGVTQTAEPTRDSLAEPAARLDDCPPSYPSHNPYLAFG